MEAYRRPLGVSDRTRSRKRMSPAPVSALPRFIRDLANREVLRLMLILTATAFLADWASKAWALDRLGDSVVLLGVVSLGVFRNEGFAFSTGHGEVSVMLVAALRIVALATILLVSRRFAHLLSRRSAYGVALVFAGGFGNVADLFFRGAVVDFIGAGPLEIGGPEAPLQMHVVFNVADVFIVVGLGMMAPCIHRGAKAVQRRITAWERRMLSRISRALHH